MRDHSQGISGIFFFWQKGTAHAGLQIGRTAGQARGVSLQEGKHLELFRQVLQEPGVLANAVNGDAIGRVADKHLADDVHALAREVQVGREAVLHAHDPLHHSH